MSIYEKHRMRDARLPFIFHDYRFPGGVTAATGNWHENLELLYIAEGTCTVTSNEQRLTATAGDIVVINPHCIHALSSASAFRYLVLIVDRSFCLANHFDTNGVTFRSLVRDPELVTLITEAMAAYTAKDSLSRVPLIRARVLAALALLLARYTVKEGEGAGESHLLSSVKRALGYIHSEYRTPLSLDILSEIAGISKYYLAREFRRLTGTTVVNYVNSYRCERAKPLLAEGKLTVEAVGYSVGFSSASYFTRIFRRFVGVSPSEYRLSPTASRQ